MPHPLNKRERFLFGKWKGEKRVKGETAAYTWYDRTDEEKKECLRIWEIHRRNTTKICSCWSCGNPRRKEYRKADQLTMQERRHDWDRRFDPKDVI